MTDHAEQIYDSLLVVRAQAGDETAFGELVERFSPRLRYFLRKLLASADGAEDALQDVVGSSRVDLQACKLEYSIVSPK